MFLGIFDASQKQAFLALAHHLVAADDKLAAQELDLLTAMKTEMGLPADTLAPIISVEDAVTAFGHHRVRVAALLELIGIALVDDDLDPDEVVLLKQVKRAFGISPARFVANVNWVMRQMALAREAEAMLTGEA